MFEGLTYVWLEVGRLVQEQIGTIDSWFKYSEPFELNLSIVIKFCLHLWWGNQYEVRDLQNGVLVTINQRSL